ncbi:MAG: RMD1 family protein [Patescibacteria group bacterium]|nr:RMD1 family protein [Patescibacteria group bacterium]MDE2015643.1 RMD1 family protein [Patescibacteria group bacterium]MDE2226700.1 RMD1 family protein [Patescibacteria group bacterium]
MPNKQRKNPKKFDIETRYLGERTDLKKLQEGIKKYKFLNRDHPLVVQLLEEQYAVLTKFGTITFWNVDKVLARQFIKEISPFVRAMKATYDYSDTIKVHVGAESERVSFEEVDITELDVEKIKIISYVSAQSVALDRYEEEINVRLDELGRVVDNLKSSGRTRFNQANLLKQVGNILSVKQSTVSSLSLFDKPDETWEREEIEKIYEKLRTEYELIDRFDVLNEKIDFLSENNTTLLNFITAQKANLLEWIVIILIVVEIFIFIWDILRK